ncbi:MAG TPA: AAA family ATPase, partial [Actinomycetota bacterium]|nr:AAA family ATPase [Actinomycetota bacterium]
RAIETIVDDFDFVLIDCPPSLGLITVNGLAAAHEVLVPIQCEYYALEGLGQLLRNVRLIQQNVNPDLRLSGIVMTMFDARTKLSEQVVAEVRRYFGARVFDTVIPRTVRLSEAPGYGQPITLYDPMSRGAIMYRSLAKELAERGPEDEALPQLGDLPNVIQPAERPPPERSSDEADTDVADQVVESKPIEPESVVEAVVEAVVTELDVAGPPDPDPEPVVEPPDAAIEPAEVAVEPAEPVPPIVREVDVPMEAQAEVVTEIGDASSDEDPGDQIEPGESAPADLERPGDSTSEAITATDPSESAAPEPEVVGAEADPRVAPSGDEPDVVRLDTGPGPNPESVVEVPDVQPAGRTPEPAPSAEAVQDSEAPRKKFRLFRRGGEE